MVAPAGNSNMLFASLTPMSTRGRLQFPRWLLQSLGDPGGILHRAADVLLVDIQVVQIPDDSIETL